MDSEKVKTANPANQTELFLFSASSPGELIDILSQLSVRLESGVTLSELALSCFRELQAGSQRISIVAKDLEDLQQKANRSIEKLSKGIVKINDTSGIYYTENPIGNTDAKIGFLFPGEGSQYPGMLGDLAETFPEVGHIIAYFEEMNTEHGQGEKSITRFFRPADSLSKEDRKEVEGDLKRIDHAMFAILIADWLMYNVVDKLGIKPDTIAGHSGGELVALMASGVLTGSEDHFITLCEGFRDLGKYAPDDAPESRLLAIGKSAEFAEEVLAHCRNENDSELQAFVAMKNCPHQTVIVGTRQSINLVEKEIAGRGVISQPLLIEQPYHTPLFAPYMEALRKMFHSVDFHPVNFPIYSCTTAELFPGDSESLCDLTLAHWESPVEFIKLIENQYRDGVRCFIEIGPRNHLCSFTEDILRGKLDTLIIPSNVERNSGITQVHHLVAQLFVNHFPVDPTTIYEGPNIPMDTDHLTGLIEEQGQLISQGDPVGNREAVLAAHFKLMEEFLEVQQSILQQYFSSSTAAVSPTTYPLETTTTLPDYPLVDETIEFEAGHRIVARRSMVLHEDIFSDQHTVGGRELSSIDPGKNGLPIVPMTFSIEMFAEVASLLCPGMVVSAMNKVKLYKWLDYSDKDNAIAQVSAEIDHDKSSANAIVVEAKLYHWKDDIKLDLKRPAATAIIEMLPAFPTPPAAVKYEVINERPCSVTIPQLYQNLFHGEEFQGVERFGKFGDDGIAADVRVLPRHNLFRSNQDPQFISDPVLLDVALHPMCAWHLEQENQSGRILLPIGVDRIEFYGPRPEPGSRLVSQGKIAKETSRQFTQEVDLIDANGNVWCSMQGSHYWRFYLPFRKFNFHGPKNVYMLSESCEWVPAEIGSVQRLDVPDDLSNPTMQPIGAKVTLSDEEYARFQALEVPHERRTQWLFGRITAKEAVRVKWAEISGEMLFTADVVVEHDEHGRPHAMLLDRETPDNFPSISISHCGMTIVAIASDHSAIGIDVEAVSEREDSFINFAFSRAEINRIEAIGSDRDEWLTRFWSAKEAVGKALGKGLVKGPRSVEVIDVDTGRGTIQIKLGKSMIDSFPDYRDLAIEVETAIEDGLATAITVGKTSPLNHFEQPVEV